MIAGCPRFEDNGILNHVVSSCLTAFASSHARHSVLGCSKNSSVRNAALFHLKCDSTAGPIATAALVSSSLRYRIAFIYERVIAIPTNRSPLERKRSPVNTAFLEIFFNGIKFSSHVSTAGSLRLRPYKFQIIPRRLSWRCGQQMLTAAPGIGKLRNFESSRSPFSIRQRCCPCAANMSYWPMHRLGRFLPYLQISQPNNSLQQSLHRQCLGFDRGLCIHPIFQRTL